MAHKHTGTGPCHSERAVGDTTVLELRGEIDIATTTPLSARLDALTAAPAPDLVVDLRPVSFIDCAGLGVLCRARRQTEARQGRLRLVSDSACFRRLLGHTGLAGVFEVHTRLADALRPTPRDRRPAGAARAARTAAAAPGRRPLPSS